MFAHRTPLADFLRRLFAAGGAALVFALTVLAASPALHDLLHKASDTTHDDACPVVLFASSAIVPTGAVTAPLPPVVTTDPLRAVVAREIFVAPPRYLRLPERGPPARA